MMGENMTRLRIELMNAGKRINQLVDENKELRAEIERLRAAAGGEQGGVRCASPELLRSVIENAIDRVQIVYQDAEFDYQNLKPFPAMIADEILSALQAIEGGERGGEQASPSTETANTSNT